MEDNILKRLISALEKDDALRDGVLAHFLPEPEPELEPKNTSPPRGNLFAPGERGLPWKEIGYEEFHRAGAVVTTIATVRKTRDTGTGREEWHWHISNGNYQKLGGGVSQGPVEAMYDADDALKKAGLPLD